MAEKKASAASSTAPIDGTAPAPAMEEEAPPQGWVEVASDRLVYKPEVCQGKAICGILLARLELPEGPNGAEWHAYVIRLQKPTLGVDREDHVLEVPAGQEILLPETYRLSDLAKAAENPAIAWEVWIKPKNQVSIGQGKKMWTYTILVNPRSKPRTEDMKFFISGPQAPKQIVAGGQNSGSIGANAPDVPFG